MLGIAAHAILRIGTGLLFFQHGAPKALGLFGGFGGDPGATAPFDSLIGLSGWFEVIGGPLIALGLLTRPVAAILALEMVIAYVRSHMFEGLMPIQNRGELALLYLLVFLFFAVRGAGPLSLDGWIRSRKGEATAPQGAGF